MARRTSGGITVERYSPDQRESVARLICDEYGGSTAEKARHLIDFYEHPYQRDHAIILVAFDQKQLVGLQTLFRWPYRRAEIDFRSLQSGHSLIAKSHRGNGVFGRMLHEQDLLLGGVGVDFLIGFPVDASLGSFVRGGWVHLFDLTWYIRPISLSAALQRGVAAKSHGCFVKSARPFAEGEADDVYSLSVEAEFIEWRGQLRVDGSHFYLHHEGDSGAIQFDVRIQRKGRMTVMVIGGVVASRYSPALLDEGLRALVREARSLGFVSGIALAMNSREYGGELRKALQRRLFVPFRSKIHFIAKMVECKQPELAQQSHWRLFRGDIDTW